MSAILRKTLGLLAAIPGARGSARGIFGMAFLASGRFSEDGDAQTGLLVLRRVTTDATLTVLTSDGLAPGANNQLMLPALSASAMRVLIVARQVGADVVASWEFTGLLRRHGTPALTGISSTPAQATPQPPLFAAGAPTGWTAALAVDTTHGALRIEAVGPAAATVEWVAFVIGPQVRAG